MGKSTFTGPVAGAYYPITLCLDDGGSGDWDDHLPAGLKIKVFGVSSFATSTTGGAFIVGTAATANAIHTTGAWTAAQTSEYEALDGSEIDGDGNFTIDPSDGLRTLTTGTVVEGTIVLHGFVVGHTSELDQGGL